MVYCSKCGKKNDDDAEFCKKCGKPLKKQKSRGQETGYKRLYRSGKENFFGGVCGGIAEYFEVDPLLVRIIFIIGLIFSLGAIILLYLILWLIIPRNPNHSW